MKKAAAPASNQDRIFGYDLIKTIAIFMIVFYHVGGLDFGTVEPNRYYIPNLNKFITSFCAASVPLFLMVNGALIVPKNLHWKQLLFKALHLLFILFFWKFILQYVISYRILSIQEDMVHFWFLGTLSVVYLVSIFLNKFDGLRQALLFVLLLFPFAYNFFVDLAVFLHINIDPLFYSHKGFFTLYAILYFYVGYYLRSKRMHAALSWGLVILGILLINWGVTTMSNHYQFVYDGVNGSFPTLGALALSIGLFMILKDRTSKANLLRDFVTWIGRNTMGIYLFHVLFVFLLRYFLWEADATISLLMAVVITSVIIVISALLGNMISNSRVSFLLKTPVLDSRIIKTNTNIH